MVFYLAIALSVFQLEPQRLAVYNGGLSHLVHISLGDGVTVAQQILDLLVLVRIQVPQPFQSSRACADKNLRTTIFLGGRNLISSDDYLPSHYLSRRPGKFSPCKKMHMDMKNRLASFRPIVKNQAIILYAKTIRDFFSFC